MLQKVMGKTTYLEREKLFCLKSDELSTFYFRRISLENPILLHSSCRFTVHADMMLSVLAFRVFLFLFFPPPQTTANDLLPRHAFL
jgi:hypothetical protein